MMSISPFATVIFTKSEGNAIKVRVVDQKVDGPVDEETDKVMDIDKGYEDSQLFSTLALSDVRVRSNLFLLYCNSLLLSVSHVLPPGLLDT